MARARTRAPPTGWPAAALGSGALGDGGAAATRLLAGGARGEGGVRAGHPARRAPQALPPELRPAVPQGAAPGDQPGGTLPSMNK